MKGVLEGGGKEGTQCDSTVRQERRAGRGKRRANGEEDDEEGRRRDPEWCVV